MRRRARLAAAAVLAGAALAGLGQLRPPLHLLTHEFTQGFTLIGALAGFLLARRVARGAGRPEAALAASLPATLAFGLGAWLVHRLVDGPVHGCRFARASLVFWLTWGPAAALAAAAGTRAAGWSRRRVALALLGFLAASLVHDLGQAALGLRITDPLLGAPRFVDQRAALSVDAVDALERAWLLGVAWAAWAWGGGRRWPALAVALVAALGGSRLGLGWGRGAQRSVLDRERETPHFAIRYAADGAAAPYVDLVAREAEWQWASVAPDMGVGDEVKVRLLLYDDAEQMERLTGIHAAHAWLWRVDLPWWSALDGTLRHELVHALHAEVRPNPLIALSRAFVEGTATAWGEGLVWDRAAHAEAAAMLANGDLPHATEVFDPFGFNAVLERSAYEAAGSFLGWLVLTEGADKLWRVQRTATFDWEAVYGADLATLDERWRAFLATVPVDLATRAEARRRYDRRRYRAYFARPCPKLGRVDPRPDLRAAALADLLACDDATALYAELWADQPVPAWAEAAGRLELQAGSPARALDWAERGLALEGIGPDEAQGLREVALGAHLLLGEVEAARADLAAMPDATWRGLAGLLEDEAGRRDLAAVLASRDPARRREAVRALAARHPEDPGARLLLAEEGFSLPGDRWNLGLERGERAELDEALALARRDPELCDALAPELARAGVRLAQQRELDRAGAIAAVFEATCTRAFTKLAARRLRERIAWERAHR